jgi:hypothetical protein
MSFFFDNMADAVNRDVHLADGIAQKFWRTEDPIWVEDPETKARRVTVGGMWPTARAWWEDDHFIKVLVGGFGSSKTFSLCKRMIALALQNAPAPVAVVSPAFTMAMKTVVPTIKLLLTNKRSLYGRAFWWRYVQNPIPCFTIRYHGRTATIWVISSDNPMSMRGPNLAAAGVDEAFMHPRAAYDEVIGRVREPTAVHREICLVGTPENLSNWGYELCTGELGNPDDIGIHTISTLENKVLPDSFIANMEATYSSKVLQAYRDGRFTDMTEGQVYYEYDHLSNVVDLPIPESAKLGVGMDFNVNPMSAVVFWHAGSHIHFFEEIQLQNSGTDAMCHELRKRFPKLRDVYPDASGAARKTATPQTDFTIIQQHGFEIHAGKANPPIRDRENTVNGKLRAANGRVTLTISPACKLLKRYLALYTVKDKPKQKEMSHLIDAMGYPICRLFPLANFEVREVRFST